MENIYTPENFKAMKKDLKLNNKDIAVIIGKSEHNVKLQTSPKAVLGTWARSMIFVWLKNKESQKTTPEGFLDENYIS